MERNLTNGSAFKNIVFFSLPFLLSYFLQTLYGMADLFIIGQFCKVSDITAVSVGSQVMHMLTVMIVGLAMGTTVSVSRYVGAGDKEGVSSAIGNTITIFVIAAAGLTALMLVLAKPVVSLMSTPKAAFAGTVSYLRICFAGIPFIIAYNVLSSIFRGLGDSKSHMYFIALSCAANIVLDYVFIGLMGMGPAGAALGTTLSQTLSVVTAIVAIRKRDMGINIKKGDLRPVKAVMGQILKIGIPIALQDGFVQISFLVITIIANLRGLNDSAAVGIVEKLIGIFFLVPSSMLSSVSAIAAQNFGAKKPKRARLTLKYGIFIAACFGILVSCLAQVIPEVFVGIFTDDSAVMRLGGQYLRSYSWDCIFAGATFCFSGYFCALEKSGISFVHNVISILLVRIPVAYFMSAMYKNTLFPMGFASPLGSLMSLIICVGVYLYLGKNEKVKI